MVTLHKIGFVYRNFSSKGMIKSALIYWYETKLYIDIGAFPEKNKFRGVLMDFYYAFPSNAKRQFPTDLNVHLPDPFNPPECRFSTPHSVKVYNKKSDVYNFGQLLSYVSFHFSEMNKVRAEKKWKEETVDSLPFSFSSAIKNLLRRCLDTIPSKRPSAIGELLLLFYYFLLRY